MLAEYQNFYADTSFVDDDGNRFALDIKSTYRTGEDRVNGMTLGAFTGYFRDRTSTKNITFPYGSYLGHFVLGMIYSKTDDEIDERKRYTLDELESITSVIRDFRFFVQQKFQIASDHPGSGNTKNIGSVKSLTDLTEGNGHSSELGEDEFDNYWMFYMTKDMARAAELPKRPYINLQTYREYRGLDR